MSSRVFISTECTKCGGLLNLEEGTNAITCPYCSSSFLVTGYDKVLSYYIPKNLDERRTVALSLSRRHLNTLPDPYRIKEVHLFYFPFYRLRGKIFQFETNFDTDSSDSLNYRQGKVRTRHLERSFPATSLDGLNFYSLGVRTSVLKLNFFEKDKLEEMGKIYPVTMDTDKALETGLGKDYQEETDHCVISRILSIVYSPLWEVNVKGIDKNFSIIIDAVGESIIEHSAPYQFLTDNLKEADSGTPPKISFHALQCPNCGWDIAAKPELFVFLCDNCHRAWESGPEGFQEAAGAAARVNPVDELPQLIYYPFWILSIQNSYRRLKDKVPNIFKLFIPAFKVRDLMVIFRLGTSFTNVQPELDLMPLSDDDLPSSRMEGAVMRWNDARELAELILLSSVSSPPKDTKTSPMKILSRELIWLPFYEKGLYIRDAILNQGIQKGKIRSPKLNIS
jgi:DNA-directed RNA polymerase subunit RPC12/RpoP